MDLFVVLSNRSLPDRVNHRPIFEKLPNNVTAVLGESVFFEIKIVSDYHHSWTWFRQKCSDDSVCGKVKIEVKEMKCLNISIACWLS